MPFRGWFPRYHAVPITLSPSVLDTDLKKKLATHALRFIVLALGISVLIGLIDHAGPDRVLQTLVMSVVWLPLVIALEGAWVAWDILLARHLYGADGKKVPTWAYIRSAIMAYPFMALLPAGRAGAEACRAACLAKYVGGAKAAAAAAQSQGCGLLGNALVSVLCAVVSAAYLGWGHLVTLGIVLNGLAAVTVGLLFMAGLKHMKVGGWLSRQFKGLEQVGPHFDAHLKAVPTFPFWPICYSFCGRLTQTVQYAFFVVAVGGVLSVPAAFIAQGVHLIGAAVGDMVPSQVGITDGAYALAAHDLAPILGLQLSEGVVAEAVSIALLGRFAQLFWSLLGALVPMLWAAHHQPQTVPNSIALPMQSFATPVIATNSERRD